MNPKTTKKTRAYEVIKKATVYDIPPSLFIISYAEFLKKSRQIEIPSWINIIKTGTHRKNAPYDQNWFYYRLASLARKFYIRGGKGVGGLRKIYGGKKRGGCKKAKKKSAGGKLIRFALVQLEKLKIIQINYLYRRCITHKAQHDMDLRAKKILDLRAKKIFMFRRSL